MGSVQILSLSCCILVVWMAVSVRGSGCQHQCDCGFKWTGDDTDEGRMTLRYEVMGGLIGAFGSVLLGGLTYFIYRKCNRPTMPGKGSLSAPWRRESTWARSRNSPRGTTPISLYGERDDSFLSGNSSVPDHGNPNSIKQPNSSNNPLAGALSGGGRDDMGLTSHYTNVHKNHPGNDINQWFKNVNTAKY